MEADTQLEATEAEEFDVETSTDRGASLVEYALLVALIAMICIAAVTLLGNQASSHLTSAANSLN
jgi:pilus assembly protein Flp/PilA